MIPVQFAESYLRFAKIASLSFFAREAMTTCIGTKSLTQTVADEYQ